MKIWITRDTAGSITGGGLERLHVWFRKPQWVEYTHEWDSPFYDDPLQGIRHADWFILESNVSGICHHLSFGKMFGYNDRNEEGIDKISRLMWDTLGTHFGSKNLRHWQQIEDEGYAHRKDFRIELELNISLK